MADKPAQPKRRRRRWRRWVCLSALALLALVALDYYAYPYGSWTNGRSLNRGENGLWLRYTWYFGEKSDADIQTLAWQLQERQVRYAWFHVRSIGKDGALRYRYPDRARRLVKALHEGAPSVKVMAWVYAGNVRGEGSVDLANAAVRKRMVAEAVWLTADCGFDGVQWDYEICPDRDAGFLALVRETRGALPKGKLLSIATSDWLPAPLGRYGWSEDYFTQLAPFCDQMAVMVYDTGFWLPRAYAWLAGQQAVHVTQAVARGNPRCRVLLGLPTYGKGLPSHNPRAENIAVALKGVRDGLADPAANTQVFAGVAVFADYTTDPSEWATYRRLWVER